MAWAAPQGATSGGVYRPTPPSSSWPHLGLPRVVITGFPSGPVKKGDVFELQFRAINTDPRYANKLIKVDTLPVHFNPFLLKIDHLTVTGGGVFLNNLSWDGILSYGNLAFLPSGAVAATLRLKVIGEPGTYASCITVGHPFQSNNYVRLVNTDSTTPMNTGGAGCGRVGWFNDRVFAPTLVVAGAISAAAGYVVAYAANSDVDIPLRLSTLSAVTITAWTVPVFWDPARVRLISTASRWRWRCRTAASRS
jgi:hypothetical protein